MNALTSLENKALHQSTLNWRGKEKEATENVLMHIQEIERRRLFAEMGHGSLFEYCTRELHYSESSAYRRIQAAKLLADVPEAIVDIKNGTLNLTNLAQVQSFIRKQEKRSGEKLTNARKKELIIKINSCTQEGAKKVLIATFPDLPQIQEKERLLPDGKKAITLILSEEFQEKLNRIKELNSHKSDNPAWSELFESLADEHLKRHDPLRKKVTQSLTAGKNDQDSKRRKTRITIVRTIHQRAGARCEYIDTTTGRRCARRYHLQIDHKMPISRGGTNEFANLQLLCRSHNLWKGRS